MHPSPKPDIYDNARFEQIACAGLTPKYKGSPDQLILTLNLINLHHQNEVWHNFTLLTINNIQVDLIKDFSKITLQIAQQQVQSLWDIPDTNILWHTRGTMAYNSRLFALFFLNLMAPNFAALIHSRIDQCYCTDDPLLFLTMCNHIRQNHLAFVISIQYKINFSTLAEHNNNSPTYLQFLQDNIRIITSTGDADAAHSDLLPHMFMQLCNNAIPLFQQKVLTWQRQYMENILQLLPMKFITMADEECQILKHSSLWVEKNDPSVMAKQAMVQGNIQGA
jgi:hypothetical protein